MAHVFNEEISAAVRDLITKISGWEPGSRQFTSLEGPILSRLKNANSMYFLNTKDIEKEINSMAAKFAFHGLPKHGDYLRLQHEKYIDKNLPESDLSAKLNFVKFLLCMSESPTNYFWEHPEEFQFQEESPEEEDIDWGAYLNEGIAKWCPSLDESLEISDFEEDTLEQSVSDVNNSSFIAPKICETVNIEEYDFQKCRNLLLSKIQHSWYDGTSVAIKPSSNWSNANISFLWEEHLKSQVCGLIPIGPTTVITEYQVMREILWQMCGPHNSVVFELQGDILKPRQGVSISSIRDVVFRHFVTSFIPYIELMEHFRKFCSLVEDVNSGCPRTFSGYSHGVRQIMQPIRTEILKIEDEVRSQDVTMTLLILANKFQAIFLPLHLLKQIHGELFPTEDLSSNVERALKLLTHLRKSLQMSINKLDEDIRFTLYLCSLDQYFFIVDSWLVRNDFSDYTQEFVIKKESLNMNISCVTNVREITNPDDFRLRFGIREGVEKFLEIDGVVRIICEDVLEIGRNLDLLRLLENYHVFNSDRGSIHEEFVKEFLRELEQFHGGGGKTEEDNLKIQVGKPSGDSENMVDTIDGFLSLAFRNFFQGGEDSPKKQEQESLFERIKKMTTSLVFPLQDLPEQILAKIIKNRFRVSGLMVKNLLIDKYGLDKNLYFFGNIFLFTDDLIFPFYCRLFQNMNITGSDWGNSIWLTGHLQDVIADAYPTLYEDCSVTVDRSWKQCRDSLEACSLISIHYDPKWPLNIVMTPEHVTMYQSIFQFILKLKWALFTTSHLRFTDIEQQRSLYFRKIKKRLSFLRFSLLNMFHSVQHYVFGSVFATHRIQFELDFEKAHDLKSLTNAHAMYIQNIYTAVQEVQNSKRNGHGFNTGLRCVKILKVMWNKKEHATIANLEKCRDMYAQSFELVNSLVNPVYI